MLYVSLTADETGRVSCGPTASSLPTLLLLIRFPGRASLLIMRTRHIWSEQQVSVPACGIIQRNPSHPGRNQESPRPLWYYKAYTIDLSCSLCSPGQIPVILCVMWWPPSLGCEYLWLVNCYWSLCPVLGSTHLAISKTIGWESLPYQWGEQEEIKKGGGIKVDLRGKKGQWLLIDSIRHKHNMNQSIEEYCSLH